MERKLKKGFEIAKVDGVLNEFVAKSKNKKNIFDKLATAIGNKAKSSKEALSARSRSTVRKDLIGSSQARINRLHSSLKARIQYENEQFLQTMSPEKIQEYNPNLKHETNQTKIAYAKFKVGTIKAEKERRRKLHEQNKIQDVIEETRSSQEESSNASISYENETKRPGSDHD